MGANNSFKIFFLSNRSIIVFEEELLAFFYFGIKIKVQCAKKILTTSKKKSTDLIQGGNI